MTFEDIKKELTDSEALILTCYGEARGESPDGQIAVMQVIMNRSKLRRQTIKEVCFAKLQFSCWNANDPNYPILCELAEKVIAVTPVNNPTLDQIIYLANGVTDNKFFNLVSQSQHYMTNTLFGSSKRPSWADDFIFKRVIGSHTFLVLRSSDGGHKQSVRN